MILTGISVNQIPLDWDGNTQRIIESLKHFGQTETYKSNSEHIIIFPELALSGYGCEDGFLFSNSKKKSWKKLKEIIKFSQHLKKSLILMGFPFYYQGNIYNSTAVIHNGQLKAVIPKSYLAGEGIHYEQRWFTPYKESWKLIQYTDFQNETFEFLFGQGVIKFQQIRLVIEICEDAWINHRPVLLHYSYDIDLILNPAASHAALGKYQIRKNIAKSSSQYYFCYYFSVNLLGNESGKSIYDGGMFLAKNGNILRETVRYSYYDAVIQSFPIYFSELRNQRDRIFSRRYDKQFDSNSIILNINLEKTTKKPIFEITSSPENEKLKNIIYFNYNPIEQREEKQLNDFLEFLDITRLGLFDYLRKTYNKGYTISLSGGADSSLCAILVYEMLYRGVKELGISNFIKKMKYIFADEREIEKLKELSDEEFLKILSRKILHTIYQKTINNKETTLILANELAKEIFSDHIVVDIQNLVDDSIILIEESIQKKFTWEEHNIPLQNIQARIRSPIAWLFANITYSILIATSNRSEASVGYTTMDGDSSGGIAPLAGIDKSFILKFLEFISDYSDPLTQKIITAKKITSQKPSAELKPISEEQTDEKALMPYPILTMIERMAIEELLSPEEIYHKIQNIKYDKIKYNYSQPYYRDFMDIIKQYEDKEIKKMLMKQYLKKSIQIKNKLSLS